MATKLVKVESLDTAIELYHAGLLCWYDGEAWSRANRYGGPNTYNIARAYISVED